MPGAGDMWLGYCLRRGLVDKDVNQFFIFASSNRQKYRGWGGEIVVWLLS